MKNKFNSESLKPFIDFNGLTGTEEVERKRMSSRISIVGDEEKTIVAVISNSTEDADGDVIIPTGVDLKRFMNNPVICWSHDYSEPPIGKCVALSVSEEGILAKIKLADTPRANDIWSLVKGGFLSGNSVGFIIKEAYRRGTEVFDTFIKQNKIKIKESTNRIISKWELLENSLCTIGCNPEALVQAISEKSINLSDQTIKELDLPKVIVVEKKEVTTEEKSLSVTETPKIEENKENVTVKENKSPACRKKDETKEECIARKIPEIMGEGMSQEQATAMAYSMCEKSCEEKNAEFKEMVKESSRYIKVVRSGGVDIKKLAELRQMVIKGKIL